MWYNAIWRDATMPRRLFNNLEFNAAARPAILRGHVKELDRYGY